MDSQLESNIIISMHFKVFFPFHFAVPGNFAGERQPPPAVAAAIKKKICNHITFFPIVRAEITSVNNDEVSWEVHKVAIDKVANIKAWKWV